mmetsp:Transcript_18187/g.37910  ORF Transcript_18187/g.37910 Transcript_18187/m.37910 type:complete len:80 (+) Transcript_18187:90-329(+)
MHWAALSVVTNKSIVFIELYDRNARQNQNWHLSSDITWIVRAKRIPVEKEGRENNTFPEMERCRITRMSSNICVSFLSG